MPVYALEGKVAECGDLMTPTLGNDKEMKKAVKKIAFKVMSFFITFLEIMIKLL